MTLNIEQEVTAMERMTVNQLREKYEEVFGEPTNGRHKQWLIKRIAWRMQANAEGGLSERARRRAMELANEADLRVTIPRVKKEKVATQVVQVHAPEGLPKSTQLLPGMLLQRVYKGETIRVKVLENGFEYQGERYKSLTAVTRVVTGKHWNGPHFFGLRKNGGSK